jgi:hypothetical protein
MQLLMLALILFSLPHPVGFGSTGRDPRRVLRASRKSCSHFNFYSAKSQVAQQAAISEVGDAIRFGISLRWVGHQLYQITGLRGDTDTLTRPR